MTIHTQTVEHLAACADCRSAAMRIIGTAGGQKGGRSKSPAKQKASRANVKKAHRATERAFEIARGLNTGN